jgi:RNA polymerase sigma-70 factor, ECF subfamily
LNALARPSVYSSGTDGSAHGGAILDTLSDEDLVALARDGQPAAFDRLAVRVEDGVYRFVCRTIGDRDEARDLCQETLVRAWENLARLRDGSKFRAWVHHIALNLCRDRFRTAVARADHREWDDEGPEARRLAEERDERGGAAGTLDRIGQARAVERALARLSEEQRTAILLRECQGFTTEEIAEITGVPVGTVRTRIFHGLRALRRMLHA